MSRFIILDWDDTLMDTHSLKVGFNQILTDLKISPAEAELLIADKFQKENLSASVYSPEFVAQTLLEGKLISKSQQQELLQKTDQYLAQSHQFIPESSIDFIKTIKTDLGIEPIILSFGNQIFQEKKIKSSGLIEKVGPIPIHIIQSNKADYLLSSIIPQIKDNEIVCFINDKETENQEVAQKTGLRTILKLPFYQEKKINDSPVSHQAREVLPSIAEKEPRGYTWKEILVKLKQLVS